MILPKRGRHNKEDKERESNPAFKKLRNAHSAVESSINMLEHHGLNRCMDKGLRGYKRCVGLSVLAYNLHILGNVLKAKAAGRRSQKRKTKAETSSLRVKDIFKTAIQEQQYGHEDKNLLFKLLSLLISLINLYKTIIL
ncbi:MAG: hypothetical protein WKG06_44495 [Segetibacter sp.]